MSVRREALGDSKIVSGVESFEEMPPGVLGPNDQDLDKCPQCGVERELDGR